jgi:predicted metal-dependent hydrolase
MVNIHRKFLCKNIYKFLRIDNEVVATTSKGQHYDLKAIYHVLNRDYFKNKLNLEITWFSNAQRKAKYHRRLGLFCYRKNLIKIHRLLDQPHFPPYFISYVIYHEMLHSVCPPVKSKRGKYSIHHPTFKAREREFVDYAVAKRWEEENKKLFFTIDPF